MEIQKYTYCKYIVKIAKNISYLPWVGYNYALINARKIYNYVTPTIGKTCNNLETYKIIYYNNDGKNYFVYVPYNESKKFMMDNLRVFLFKNNEKIDITHESGVPYMLKASDMGGEYIEVVFCDMIYRYADKPPMYCDDLLD